MAKKESLSTHEFLEIDRIVNDTVVLKTGGIRKILLVSGINTELKSEAEQNAIYFAFQTFLNSLEFSLQLVIHSRKLNIQGYIQLLEKRLEEESNDLLKNAIEDYKEFIKSFVAENEIMTKNFFASVPFDPASVPIKKSPVGGIFPALPFLPKKEPEKEKKISEAEEENFKKNLLQLNQRVDQVARGLQAIGLRAVALNNEELIELFFNLYNPESAEKKELEFVAKEKEEE